MTNKVSFFSLDVCWLRLDFETFAIQGPPDALETTGGVCVDTFTVTVSINNFIKNGG